MIELRKTEWAEPETGQPDISIEVLKRRCLLKDHEGHIIETPEQMYMRVARTIAEVESRYGVTQQMIQLLCQIFYKLMAGGKFLPNSPTLMNAGQKEGLRYSSWRMNQPARESQCTGITVETTRSCRQSRRHRNLSEKQ